jgi:DNA-binding response OmpR family regulator
LYRLNKAKERAETANAAKNRLLAAFTEDLRSPLRAIARAGTEGDRTELDPNQADLLGRIRLSVRSMLLQLDDLLDFIQVDDGSLTPGVRSFDFYRLSHGVVASLNATAAERGVELNLHIDPALPHQLHGWAHQLRQILICLITNAIQYSANSRVRINARAVDLGTDRVTVRIALACGLTDNHLETADQVPTAAAPEAGRHLGLALAERWVGLMEGRLRIDNDRRRGLSLAVELPFAIDQTSLGLPVDLAQLPVLIVSEDVQFVEELAEPLEAWRAKVRWIGAGHDALDHLEALEATPGERRPVLIVDGRDDVLLSLSWTHRAASLWALRTPPLVMFIADESRIDSIVGLADGELDSILSAPFALDALRGAFHALGIEPGDRPSAAAEPASRSDLAEGTRAAPLPTASDTPAKRGRRILIAASSPANRRIMSSILSREGHTVNLVETVDEARKGLEARAVDLLLLDLTGAPGSDYEAARLCRRARPSLIIVALTRDSAEEAERQARELGIDAVVPKPIDPRRLVAVIDTAIDGEPTTPLPFRVVGRPASYPRYAGEPSSAVNE